MQKSRKTACVTLIQPVSDSRQRLSTVRLAEMRLLCVQSSHNNPYKSKLIAYDEMHTCAGARGKLETVNNEHNQRLLRNLRMQMHVLVALCSRPSHINQFYLCSVTHSCAGARAKLETVNNEHNQRLLRNLKMHMHVLELLRVPHEVGDEKMLEVLSVCVRDGEGLPHASLARAQTISRRLKSLWDMVPDPTSSFGTWFPTQRSFHMHLRFTCVPRHDKL